MTSPVCSHIALDGLCPSLTLIFVFCKIGVIVLTSGSRGVVGRTESGTVCGKMNRQSGARETQEQVGPSFPPRAPEGSAALSPAHRAHPRGQIRGLRKGRQRPTFALEQYQQAGPGSPSLHPRGGCVRVCRVIQLYLALCDPTDCCPPGSSVHGILQARILEWVAMLSSRGSS